MRPLLGSIPQPQVTLKTAFPIAQSMIPAVRAPPTFRRLPASETLNVSCQSAFSRYDGEADIYAYTRSISASADFSVVHRLEYAARKRPFAELARRGQLRANIGQAEPVHAEHVLG